MSRPTFSAEGPLIRFVVRGVPHPKGFPYIPDDQGLVLRLGDFLEERKIYFHTLSWGGGRCTFLVDADQSDVIEEFLKLHADEVDP